MNATKIIMSKLSFNEARMISLLKSNMVETKENFRVQFTIYNARYLEKQKTPESWIISRTKMIRKERRPTVRDFRPIAITNISYKIFMSLIRERIEEHLRQNNRIKENEIGFTGGGRIEYNHMIMQYIIEKTIKGR